MSQAAREALWAREKAEQPAPKPSTRIAYNGRVHSAQPGGFACVKVHDDGRRVTVKAGLSWHHADAMAGRMRDRMTDEDVGDGWNYVAERAGKPPTNV